MNPVLMGQCAVLIVLFALSAFFSSAETAYFSLNPILIHRIRRFRPKAARTIEQFLAAPTQLLSTVLIGNTLVNMAAAIVGFVLAERLFPNHGETISIPAMTVLILIFGEVAPKRVAVQHAEKLAVWYIPLLRVLLLLMAPARAGLEWVTASFQKHFRVRTRSITGEELQTAVDLGHEEGVLNREERAMMDGIIRLERVQACDVMTPRVDLVGIDMDQPLGPQLEIVRKARFRFLPAYHKTLDHIDGFLDVFKFLRSSDRTVESALIKHFYVPDTMPLDNLLTLFQHEKLHVAVVIDEYGGTAGLVTQGDVLEEIVQDVDQERGAPRLRIEPHGSNSWLVDGNVSLEDINYELDLRLDAEGADRIAGWVAARAERLPKAGDVVEAQGCRATVWEVKRHRIRTVLLEKV